MINKSFKKDDIVYDLEQDCFVKIVSVNNKTVPSIYTVVDQDGLKYKTTEDELSFSKEPRNI